MKKYIMFFGFVVFLFAGNVSSVFANNRAAVKISATTVSVKKDRFGKKRKDGSFKRKRSGFLGLWGKKSSCGCPN